MLPDIVEAVVGTAFLSPVVFSAIVLCGFGAETVIAIAAILALPIGWLAFTFERFIFTLKGRYEHYPTLEFIRNLVEVEKLGPDKWKVNLGNVLPKYGESKSTTLTLNNEEFNLLFDPYKSLDRRRMLLWKPFRHRQHNKNNLPYVENIEDIFFFDDPGLAEFIRSATANYHTYLAASYAFILGILFSFGFVLFCNPRTFLEIPSILNQINLSQVGYQEILQFIGVVFCFLILLILMWGTIRQSKIRRKEAIAHEYLLIRLKTLEAQKKKGV